MAYKKKVSHQFQVFVKAKKVIIALSLFSLALVPLAVFAQQNTVRTRVGSPKESDIIRIGKDIKGAYDSCNAGYTYENVNGEIAFCLREQLLAAGYDSELLNIFEQRRLTTLYPMNGLPPCTQCLGFVGLVLTLQTGDASSLTYWAASDVASLESFNAGGETWQRLPPEQSPEPGDIGAHGRNGAGHIIIVTDVQGASITALESNGNSDCRITDTRNIVRESLVYFRKLDQLVYSRKI